jgi:hypothetical protein
MIPIVNPRRTAPPHTGLQQPWVHVGSGYPKNVTRLAVSGDTALLLVLRVARQVACQEFFLVK